MLKIQFCISNKEEEYYKSIKEVISLLNNKKDIKDKVNFRIKKQTFKKEEENFIRLECDKFLREKYSLSEKNIDFNKFNSVVFIPDSSIILERYYLWFSVGSPEKGILIFSSFIHKKLIINILSFGAYCILLYCQYLARYTTDLSDTHDISRNCLNDFCGNQKDILNVFKNEKVLCDECISKIKNDQYYNIICLLINNIKEHYKSEKVISKKVIKERKKIGDKESKKAVIEFSENKHYEVEIYMAKKCINLSQLYKKLDDLIKNPQSEINGYSLYEVDGGWRGKIHLENASISEWRKLNELRHKYGENDFKDLIKPIFEDNEKIKYASFDERSIVLRIIFETRDTENWHEEGSAIRREIIQIFEEITEREHKIYMTVKNLDKAGSILKKDN